MNMLLLELRKMTVESVDMDEAITALAITRMVAAEYANAGFPMPEWVTGRLEGLEREVRAKRRDYLMSALARAKVKREGLKSRETKLADNAAEIAAIEAELDK